jgi:hypothetical protein
VKTIRKTRLPLQQGARLDLSGVYSDLKESLFSEKAKIRYDPESNFKAVFIICNGASFSFFSNGSVNIAGNLSARRERALLKYFWEFFLNNNITT